MREVLPWLFICLGFSLMLATWPHVAAAADKPTTWRGLTVEPENSCSPYVESDYAYNRESILLYWWDFVGAFFSPYDNKVYRHTQVDIEHRVSRHQAHVSGMCAKPKQLRRIYAHDMGNITMAEIALNRRVEGG